MVNYFENCNTVESTKAHYRDLAFRYHPDRNPGIDIEIIKAINNQYKQKLESLNGSKSVNNEIEFTYKYNDTIEQELIDKINQLLKIDFDDDIDFYLIGNWIWCSGNTRPYKENLKELGFFWNSNRLLWYYRPESQKAYYKSTRSLSDIARSYGASKIVKTDEKSKVKKLGS